MPSVNSLAEDIRVKVGINVEIGFAISAHSPAEAALPSEPCRELLSCQVRKTIDSRIVGTILVIKFTLTQDDCFQRFAKNLSPLFLFL